MRRFKRSFFLISCLIVSSLVLAQESCESLLDSIEGSFESADEVIMSTEIKQGSIEYAYTKIRLFKDEAEEWQSEQLEQRGIPRPPDAQAEDDGEEPSFEFSCELHELSETETGWFLNIEETDKDLPIKDWQLSFETVKNIIVPTEIAGTIETSILFIPFRGRFSTQFSEWQVP